MDDAYLEGIVDGVISDNPELHQRWAAKDPTVSLIPKAVTALVLELMKDNKINSLEPFLKTKPQTIIADCVNKGILPFAIASLHTVIVENSTNTIVTLSQDRAIEDNLGRVWRLTTSLSVPAFGSKEVVVEQSEIKLHKFNITTTTRFNTVRINAVSDIGHLSSFRIIKDGVEYKRVNNFYNVRVGEKVYTIESSDFISFNIVFGDSERAGKTAEKGEYSLYATQTAGKIDFSKLNNATLANINNSQESFLSIYFKPMAIVRAGSNPLTLSDMTMIAKYPSIYNSNAVYLGDFDYSVRSAFMTRMDYFCIWNESTNDVYYGSTFDDMNKLHITVVAKVLGDQAMLINDIERLIASSDSMYDGMVKVKAVSEISHQIKVKGVLSPNHDLDGTINRIKELLLQEYGKGGKYASVHNPTGFNIRGISEKIGSLVEFQDGTSDFQIISNYDNLDKIKPHEWAYLTDTSIVVELTRQQTTGITFW